jgi:hypothetical protein
MVEVAGTAMFCEYEDACTIFLEDTGGLDEETGVRLED